MKTPAFVKEKRNFFRSDPLASPTAFKNIQGRQVGLPVTREHLFPFSEKLAPLLTFDILKLLQADKSFCKNKKTSVSIQSQ